MNAEYYPTVIGIVYQIVMGVAYLAFGIANAVISAENTDAKGECGHAIWYCVMFLAVLGFIGCAETVIVFAMTMIRETELKNRTTWSGDAIMGVSIWACIGYFEADDECIDFYTSNFPDLWKMLSANVIFFFVHLVIIVIVLTAVCVIGCATVVLEKVADDFGRSKGPIPSTDRPCENLYRIRMMYPNNVVPSAPPASALDSTV